MSATAPMVNAPAAPEKAKRQCWECLKRRLVCDHTLPHCKKCQKAGKECPGYDEQKPLQWVTPGKVTSRRRHKPSTAKPKGTLKSQRPPNARHAAQSRDQPRPVKKQPQTTPDKDDSSESNVERTFFLSDRATPPGWAKMGGKVLDQDPDAFTRLEKLFRWLQMEDIPRYGLLTETSEVVQAVHYFNTRIYPQVLQCSVLAPNPHIIFFPLGALHLLPPAIHHTMVCLAVNHRLCSLPAGTDRQLLNDKWSKVYHHRGAAIRELSAHIGREATRNTDTTMSSVLMFMCAELQQSTSGNWRTHADGLIQLINMRGGMMSLYREKVYLQPGITIFLLIIILSNTTSPPHDQIHVFSPHDYNESDIQEIYATMFPYCLCPPKLFFDIVRINNLRSRAAHLSLQEIDDSMIYEANELLVDIDSFLPEDWAQPNEFYEEWLMIGTIYQSAIAIYCISSLMSLGVLSLSPNLIAIRASHADRLFLMLREAFKVERIRYFMMWPLIVAGAEAAFRGEGLRSWIEEELSECSRFQGTSTPLKARALLRRYWAREERGWDQCFDRTYCFTV
ncbi:hypothetical protein BS50DRAFT_569829 [Corynespora cassiicola Philippines]|uniref:Zn(2)-C6 fungal-type domain-containing protein n=1 Tax=Corynespora cassiicola Philippines TaxID=1448308 RepID=A0A2T2P3R1_CORCC|nr:hypothetical protein BS50DRAFT_569829 [Corynespora cassiicola Philippines]